jgi:hypothetical protein
MAFQAYLDHQQSKVQGDRFRRLSCSADIFTQPNLLNFAVVCTLTQNQSHNQTTLEEKPLEQGLRRQERFTLYTFDLL